MFQLKQLAAATLQGAPKGVRWNYDRMELLVDGVIHSFGVVGGLVAAVALVVVAVLLAKPPEIAAISIYVAGLLVMLVVSAIYNLWPVSPVKWVLRRFDHSAIYVLIAATYTPFIVEMPASITSIGLLTGVWLVAAIGITLKLAFPDVSTGSRSRSTSCSAGAVRWSTTPSSPRCPRPCCGWSPPAASSIQQA
jgi:hemolysin III